MHPARSTSRNGAGQRGLSLSRSFALPPARSLASPPARPLSLSLFYSLSLARARSLSFSFFLSLSLTHTVRTNRRWCSAMTAPKMPQRVRPLTRVSGCFIRPARGGRVCVLLQRAVSRRSDYICT